MIIESIFLLLTSKIPPLLTNNMTITKGTRLDIEKSKRDPLILLTFGLPFT